MSEAENQIREIHLSDIDTKTVKSDEIESSTKKLTNWKDKQEGLNELQSTEDIYAEKPKKEKRPKGLIAGFCYAMGKMVGSASKVFK